MLRVRVCAAHMGGFLVQNSLNKGSFFGRFSLNMGVLSRNWQKNCQKCKIFLVAKFSSNKHGVEFANELFTDIIISSAKASLPLIKTRNPQRQPKSCKKWFDSECQNKKKIVHDEK